MESPIPPVSPTTTYVVFYSTFGHCAALSEAIAEGARSVPNTLVTLWQIAPTDPPEVLTKSGAEESRKKFAHIPVIEPHQVTECDALVIGSPTQFGAVATPVSQFLRRLGGAWNRHELEGKVGSAFCSTSTQHGGHELTLSALIHAILTFGMVYVPLTYKCHELLEQTDLSGGSIFGAGTIAGNDNSRQPTVNELAIARFQGKHVAEVASKLRR